MYRVNYRQYIGTYKDQKLFFQSSFLSKRPFNAGDKVFRPEVCGDVEVHQCVVTSLTA